MAGTSSLDDARKGAQNLTAQPDATAGLKALVGAVASYTELCIDLLGSGDPGQAPDFTPLLASLGLGAAPGSDPVTTSATTAAYNLRSQDIDRVKNHLQDLDSTVGQRVSDVNGVIDTAAQQIGTAVSDLQAALDAPPLPAPPHIDALAEGRMIDACLTAVDAVHTEVVTADGQMHHHAGDIPAVPQPGWSGGSNAAPASYGTPLSSTAIQAMIAPVTDATKKKFLEVALSRVGDPYVWGATGPNAFDCSGLVQYSAEQAGIHDMPRTSSEQYAASHHPINPADLQPGDLLFQGFNDNPPPGHVLIYIGNGQVVEAPHTGDRVKVVALNAIGPFEAGRF